MILLIILQRDVRSDVMIITLNATIYLLSLYGLCVRTGRLLFVAPSEEWMAWVREGRFYVLTCWPIDRLRLKGASTLSHAARNSFNGQFSGTKILTPGHKGVIKANEESEKRAVSPLFEEAVATSEGGCEESIIHTRFENKRNYNGVVKRFEPA